MTDATVQNGRIIGTLKSGDKGNVVLLAQRRLAGHNVFLFGTFNFDVNGLFGGRTIEAAKGMKWALGFPKDEIDPSYGTRLDDYLTGRKRRSPIMIARANRRKNQNSRTRAYPLGARGRIIGRPGQGTHSWFAQPNNWQSDNAIDFSVPVGTPLVACADGKIGARIGPIDSDDPRMQGLRCYIELENDDEFYYAHASSFAVRAGQQVIVGQVIGKSGSANGSPHLHWARKSGSPVDFIEGL